MRIHHLAHDFLSIVILTYHLLTTILTLILTSVFATINIINVIILPTKTKTQTQNTDNATQKAKRA